MRSLLVLLCFALPATAAPVPFLHIPLTPGKYKVTTYTTHMTWTDTYILQSDGKIILKSETFYGDHIGSWTIDSKTKEFVFDMLGFQYRLRQVGRGMYEGQGWTPENKAWGHSRHDKRMLWRKVK